MGKMFVGILISFWLTWASSAIQAEAIYQFKTDEPIYVFGDVHGAYAELHSTLRKAGLIDENDHWSGGKVQLVSLGDLPDRGPESRKVIELLMRLQGEIAQAGGQLHVVLGNHEVMNMIGDLRYVSAEEYASFAADESEQQRHEFYLRWLSNNQLQDNPENAAGFNQAFPHGYFAHRVAYSPEGVYGKWFLTLPFIIQINDQLFAHAGLSKKITGRAIGELNDDLKQTLINYLQVKHKLTESGQLGFDAMHGASLELVKTLPENEDTRRFIQLREHLLFSLESPTWYRGNAICHPFFESEILAANLAQWNAKRLWVGHTPTASKQVARRLNNQLIVIDTGMLTSYYGGQPWLAKMDSKQLTFMQGISGEFFGSVPSPNRENYNPFGLSDAQLEDFLMTADVVSKSMTRDGRTKPMKVKLEKDGKVIEAIFKYKNESSTRGRGVDNRAGRSHDRFQNEIAAYHLDRMLNIGLIPVTVERKIYGRLGSMQLWIGNMVSMLSMEDNNVKYRGYCDQASQLNFMDAFDYLIANDDRNQSNIMYNLDDFQIWFIDQSKTFGSSIKRPNMLRDSTIKVSQEFKTALESLDRKKLDSLAPWLSSSQIESLWERRNKMISGDF